MQDEDMTLRSGRLASSKTQVFKPLDPIFPIMYSVVSFIRLSLTG